MDEKLKGFFDKAKEFVKKLSKKTIILILAALVILAAVITIVLNNRPYAVLVTRVSSEEAGAIIGVLEELGVSDYRIENSDTILVPANQESSLKAKLLMAGYPKSGFSYSTYYDHVSALSTEAERNIAYLNSIQDRMGAVVRCMDGVKDAVVNITQGEDRRFVLDKDNVVEATASVFVMLEDGTKLTSQQAAAIRNLVSHAVKGLKIDQVGISDNLGNTYNATGEGVSGEISALKLQLEEENNNRIRTNIMHALAPFFGEENIRVGVSCVVDVDRITEQETTYKLPEGSENGEGLTQSEEYDRTIIRDGNAPVGGVVGTEVNSDIPGYVDDQIELNGSEREIHADGQVDYANDERITHTERNAGYVSDCTVAVSINSTTAGAVDVASIREHVARAAGIDETIAASRISVLPMAFYKDNSNLPLPIPGKTVPEWVLYAAAGGLLLFILLMLVILKVRKKRKKKKHAVSEQQMSVEEFLSAVQMPEQQEPMGADVMSLKSEKSMELRKDIRRFADENPEIAAQMIRSLLRGAEENG